MREALDFSLILPCYKDGAILEASLEEILSTLRSMEIRFEAILVEDGSPDGTAGVIDRILREHPGDPLRAIFHETNHGRGAAVSDGFRAAWGDVVGFLDVDLETHCRHLPDLLAWIRDGADVAIARRIPRVTVRTLLRHFLSRTYNLLVRAVLGLPYRDTEAGFKLFRREKILPILDRARARGWFWDTEVIALCHGEGLRIAEVPCPFTRRPDRVSTVRPIRDSAAYLLALLAFRWRAGSFRRRAPIPSTQEEHAPARTRP